jgi:protein-cysteine N-palmitoyltransferase HHAT
MTHRILFIYTSNQSDARSQDNSDAQYRSFRLGLPALAALMATFFALKYAYTRPILRGSSPPTNYLHRVPFYLIFSLLMLIVLHGASVLKVLIILSANYGLAKATGGKRFAVPVTWLFNGGVLLANEWFGGYAFASLHSGFAFLVCHARYCAFSLPN